MEQGQIGAIIESGPSDWQIIQQDARGLGAIMLRGRWVSDLPGRVEVRLVSEDTAVPVSASLDWQPAPTLPDGTWAALVERVPAGGLYRLETRYHAQENLAGEWSTRGDMRHFLGVGDLWVIAGQSNSAGYGRGPVSDPPELGVHLFRNSEQWALAAHPMNESTDSKHVVNRELANSGHSPYLHFGRLLKRQLNYPVGLVQTALGGSPLRMWDPIEGRQALLFDNMVHCVRGAGGKVRGVLWYQGESDIGENDAPTYADRFIHAVQAWREALGNPTLPVVTVQLNRAYRSVDAIVDLGWSLVREAQRQIPKRLADVTVVPTFDLPLSDEIHNSPQGNMLLGERMARAALGAVYHQPVDYQAPDIQSAKATSDGTAIELTFQPVTSRMANIDPQAVCFRVEDRAGELPVEKVVYPGNATVLLVMARPLSGRAVVHGGYGVNPAAVPMDMERFIPMLGFYGVPVV
jgi:sialate O-acetylesterase